MAESTLMPQNAPRTYEALINETAFQLRLLAQKCGAFQTDEDKMAWHGLKTNESRAQYMVGLLQRWDAANPGAYQPGERAPQAPPPPQQQQAPQAPPQGYAPPQQQQQQQHQAPPMQQQQMYQQPAQPQYAPPQQQQQAQQYPPPPPPPYQAPPMQQQQQQQPQYAPPPVNQPAPYTNGAGAPAMQYPPQQMQQMVPVPPGAMVPVVNQQAVQGAQAAAAAGEKPKRTPRTSAAAAEPTNIGPEIVNLLTRIAEHQSGELERFNQLMKSVNDTILEAANSKTGRVAAVEGRYNEVADSLKHMKDALASSAQLQMWTLMAFLTYTSEQMGCAPTDILGVAIADSATFQQLVDKAVGKV